MAYNEVGQDRRLHENSDGTMLKSSLVNCGHTVTASIQANITHEAAIPSTDGPSNRKTVLSQSIDASIKPRGAQGSYQDGSTNIH